MTPTDTLRNEHEVIQRVLDVMERAASILEADGTVPQELLPSAIDFVRVFADGCHHAKEEGTLFPRMKEHGIPEQGGPLGVMLQEHEMGRAYIRELEQAIERDDSAQIIEAIRGYVSLLRDHIAKENDILFPMAERVLSADEQARLMEDFERAEREQSGPDVHERYVALVDQLERSVS